MMSNKANLYRQAGPFLEQLEQLIRQEGEAVYLLGTEFLHLQFGICDEVARVLGEVHDVLTELGQSAEEVDDRVFAEKVNYVRSLFVETIDDQTK